MAEHSVINAVLTSRGPRNVHMVIEVDAAQNPGLTLSLDRILYRSDVIEERRDEPSAATPAPKPTYRGISL